MLSIFNLTYKTQETKLSDNLKRVMVKVDLCALMQGYF